MPILQFKGKTAVEQYHRLVPHHVLDLDAKLSLAKKPSLDGNLIIEGDNLLALKALMPTHAGKVKCIYIDPPYNTGKEEWVYNDNLTQPQFTEWIGKAVGKEAEDACRHDKWCCMMLPRLQLLADFLSDDGVIFISIDDNELNSLLGLMEEVFGSENRIATLVWKGATDNNPTLVAIEHEYVVCWAKRRSALPAEWTDPNPAAKQFMLAQYETIRARLDTDDQVQAAFRRFIKDNVDRCQPLTHYDRIDAEGVGSGNSGPGIPEIPGHPRFDLCGAGLGSAWLRGAAPPRPARSSSLMCFVR